MGHPKNHGSRSKKCNSKLLPTEKSGQLWIVNNFLNTDTMSRLLKYLFVISTFILLATGCDLNFSPLNQISDADVWEDQQLIEAYINDMYDGLDHGYRENMLESVTDNASYLPCGADNYVRGRSEERRVGKDCKCAWTRA